MKKVLLMASAFVVMSVAAQAATISIACSTASGPVPLGAQSTAFVSNCPGFSALPGSVVVNSVSFAYGRDFTFNALNPSGVESITYNVDTPGVAFDAAGVVFNLGDPGVVGPTSGGTFADYLGAFLVTYTVTNANATVNAVTFDSQFTVDYTDTAVPEPATFALIGAGLLGAAFLRRRK